MFLDFLQKKSSATALESPVSEPKVELPVPAPTILPFKPSHPSENPLMDISETALRDLCRHRIDAFESWSRRLIDETLKKSYTADYFNYMISDDQPLIKQEIKCRIENRIRNNPGRFPRKVDAFLLEDIQYLLCRDDLYKDHFKNVLEPFYSCPQEVRSIFNRLIPIRNKLSHGNTISIHEAEQCLCYTDDLISAYKEYYVKLGKERDYNVPTFTRIKDSLGNDIVRPASTASCSWEMFCNGSFAPKIQLRSGDRYKLCVEVDGGFDPSTYTIQWVVVQNLSDVICRGTGNTVDFALNVENVSYRPEIRIDLISKKAWHRFHKTDDYIIMNLEDVLPPIEDTY